MRQHDLTFANFVLHFGASKDLLDELEDIVLPTFTRDVLVRKFEDTQYYFYEVKVRRLGVRDGAPDYAITGRFVKEAVLKRQQIIRAGKLIEDYRELETAPSAFFVLTLADHRLLYFAETNQAPSIESFSSTIQIFMRRIWREVLAARHKTATQRVTHKQLKKSTPTPVLEIIPMARQEAIADSIRAFSKVTLVRFKLIRPNQEPSASTVLNSMRARFSSLEANRVDVEIADNGGLEKDATTEAVQEAAEDPNTQILVTGKDEFGNPAKADNHKFALSVPVTNVPVEDDELSEALYEEFNRQQQHGSIRRPPLSDHVRSVLNGLAGLL